MKKLIAVLLCTLLLTSAAALAEDYTFGTDTAFRPFEYTDETGTLVGIDVELLAAIAEDQGFTYTIEPLGWDASIAACQAGQKDAMIAGKKAGSSLTDTIPPPSPWLLPPVPISLPSMA